jgi:tetratricopeptide (TPR) repeat protein
VRELNVQVDRRLAGVIESCLAHNPKDRPQTAEHLAALLREELAPLRRSFRWGRNHPRTVFALASMLLASALAATAFLVLRPPYEVRQYRRGLVLAEQGEYEAAVQCFTDALRAGPQDHEIICARGRAEQRSGDFRAANRDYQEVDRRAPSALLDFCMAYCLSRLHQEKSALGMYKLALQAGDKSPELLNNLGFSCRRLNLLPEAEGYLRQAIEANGDLQAPRHNLILVFLENALRGRPVPKEAFVHAARALEIGPASTELYWDVAALYAVAARQDPSLARPAIEFVARAVEYGVTPQTFRSNPTFAALRKNQDFAKALAVPAGRQAPAAELLLDPLRDH